jgi:undecaprenyl phosphate-alpha-L-ara4N flippase subunit ArnE
MTKLVRTILVFSLYGLISTGGLFLLKTALGSMDPAAKGVSQWLKAIFTPIFLLGFFLYCTSFLMWLNILSKYPLSYAYPIASSLVFVLVSLASFFLLREKISMVQVLGISFCLLGIVLVNQG